MSTTGRTLVASGIAGLCLLGAALLLMRGPIERSGDPAADPPVREEATPEPKPGKPGHVRVAALQCPSRMGEIESNRKVLTRLIKTAAAEGAKIVVMPECAVSGYYDPPGGITWTRTEPDENEIAVQTVAETVPGPSITYFAGLARTHSLYLSVSLIEKAEDSFFNTQVLLDPAGAIIGHHRKQNLWTQGDGMWATEGDRPLQVVETPYDRLGLMICYDVHQLATELGGAQADIVLYSVGWYGLNTAGWFRTVFPVRYVEPHGFALVSSNWAAAKNRPSWSGTGASAVFGPDGKVLAMATTNRGTEIILADIPLKGSDPVPE